ncbi:hypothetical protein ISREJYDI_CDS0127 [Pseudomonas phage UNO-G1W1]|jgi:hypothetical protein|uniref:Uncharacterized protein n=1 Tax=Pseudomonas phage UNO-G1W1 TaxID=3136609 RepID=A0AAX4MVX2_9CAUD
MIYLRYLALFVIDIIMTIFTVLPAAIIIPLFTRAQQWRKPEYTWGWIWGTYDNPPQGDEGYCRKRCPFPNELTGFKGYINRVFWMLRNPLYGLAKRMALPYSETATLVITGNPDISDKYRIPGSMMARLYEGKKLIGFEFYMVKPYSANRDVRMRLGWKMTTEKYKDKGFAQFVGTCNPFDGYGDD